MDHIGGNKVDQFLQGAVIPKPDGRPVFAISSNSTVGSVRTHGSSPAGDILLLSYDAASVTFHQSPAPRSAVFSFPAYRIYPQANGDTIFIGERNGPTTGHDIGIERHDVSGRVLWTNFYGGSGSDGLARITAASDGGFFIAAGTNSADHDVALHHGGKMTPDIWILRLDNNGNKLWSTVLGGSGTDLPKDLHAADDGGCYVFGVTTSTDHDSWDNHGSSDLYIVKLDSRGNKEWSKCLGGSGDDGSGHGGNIEALADGQGGFFVLNRTASRNGDIKQRLPDGSDFWLLHIDGAANIFWETTYGGPSDQYPTALCRTSDGSLWMGGCFYGGGRSGGQVDTVYGKTDSWVVHADSMGRFINQRVLGGAEGDELYALLPMPDNSVLAAGHYYAGTTTGSSPGFPRTAEGDIDLFFARLGPQTVQSEAEEMVAEAWTLSTDVSGKMLSVKINSKTARRHRLRITDTRGKEIFDKRIKTGTELSLGGWQPGQYIIQLTDRSGNISRKRLLLDSLSASSHH